MKKVILFGLVVATLSYADIVKEMTVYKSPYCGCCGKWIDAMKKEGFKINTIIKEKFDDVKIKNGIRKNTASCHTALIDGYVIEGHVNYSAIKKLLTEKPNDIKGLTVPGMVVGSPGMEMGDKKMPYNILAIKKDGSTVVYEKH
ncbi:MAG: DUF411 domain-containing protein [Poseidonibacter sp.]|jgi:hypothetical protein